MCCWAVATTTPAGPIQRPRVEPRVAAARLPATGKADYNATMDRSGEQDKADELTAEQVRAAAAGDRDAMLLLYRSTVDRVYRLMVRLVGYQDADDLTQRVYVRVFETLVKFQQQSRLTTWLYRVATNEALQHLRRQQQRRTVPLVAAPPAEAVDRLESDERVRAVQTALDQMQPDQRAILMLKEEAGLSYRQIASALEIPEGTVASRLNRARDQCRELLRQSGVI